ncbi:hypothetical protein P6166_17200 [Stenotrophomonas sp. HITSZ_GD]|uniref:hypothetical protein n=1 Tax=Stenotrophomonas sp. HITSZ_GD TaxID=3037248 RepID=UPI00240D502B|nr:hypothetical protein [Stenotrophomonas sp. HITSZ_GD]MDG2527092.1 hypothetical protein [Stenotrophomonas sp. HITSZ_GD]
MKKILVVLAVLAAGSAQAAPVSMLNPVPYADGSIIAGKIKSECKIEVQLAEAIKREAAAVGREVAFVPAPLSDVPGEALKLEIADAVSDGNAWIGHHKSVTVRGALLRDGAQVATFVARRNSRGGMWGAYKGSCSVLDRTVNAVGEDIAAWLAAPKDGATLGDLE